jgi:hypothetical protein
VALAEPFSQSQRVICARCGETFPYRVAAAEAGPQLVAAESLPAATRQPTFPQAREKSRPNYHRIAWTAILVLGVMVLMGLSALVLGLRTVPERRARDQKPLGYLPPDINVIAGLHVVKLLQDPVGREFASQPHLGPAEVGIVNLERWLGLPLEDLSDVVIGLKVDDRLVPRLTLVVQTMKPYDEAKVRGALKDSQQIERHQKKLYRFRLEKPPVNATLWCAGQSTLVFGLSPEDLDVVPFTPLSGIDHLPQPIQACLTDPASRTAQAWAFATADRWDKTSLWNLLALQMGNDQEALRGVRTAGVWLRFERKVFVTARCQAADRRAAQALERLLVRTRIAEKGTVHTEKDSWVTAQAEFGSESFRQFIGRDW